MIQFNEEANTAKVEAAFRGHPDTWTAKDVLVAEVKRLWEKTRGAELALEHMEIDAKDGLAICMKRHQEDAGEMEALRTRLSEAEAEARAYAESFTKSQALLADEIRKREEAERAPGKMLNVLMRFAEGGPYMDDGGDCGFCQTPCHEGEAEVNPLAHEVGCLWRDAEDLIRAIPAQEKQEKI